MQNLRVLEKLQQAKIAAKNIRSSVLLVEQGCTSRLIGSDRIGLLHSHVLHSFFIPSMNTIILILIIVAISVLAVCIALLWYMGVFRYVYIRCMSSRNVTVDMRESREMTIMWVECVEGDHVAT